jgi:hypothetical protein
VSGGHLFSPWENPRISRHTREGADGNAVHTGENQIPLTPPTKVSLIYLEVFQYLKTIKGNDILKWKNDKAIWKERKK